MALNPPASEKSLVVISADRLVRDWPPQNIDELTKEHIKTLVELKPEVALIGTGATLKYDKRL